MSAESRKRRAKALSDQPLTHVVLAFDTYMGDGEDAPDYGYAGVTDVYGPFSEADAYAFVNRKEDARFVEYQVKRLSR